MKTSIVSSASAMFAAAGLASIAAASGPTHSPQDLDRETVSFSETTSWEIGVVPVNGTDLVALSGLAGHSHLVATKNSSTYYAGFVKSPAPVTDSACVSSNVAWGVTDSDSRGCSAATTGNAYANVSFSGPGTATAAYFAGATATSFFQWSRQYFMFWDGTGGSGGNDFGFGDAEVCATNKTLTNIECKGEVVVTVDLEISPNFWADNRERAFCGSNIINWIPHPVGGPAATYTLEVVAIVEYASGPIEYTVFDGSMSTPGDGNVVAAGDFLLFTYAGAADSDSSCAVGNQGWDFHTGSMYGQANYTHVYSPYSPPGYLPSTLAIAPTFTGDIKSVTVVRRAYSDGILEPCDFVLGCPPCPADFDMNGGVDSGDVDAFLDAYENGDPCADLNGDGGVDSADLAIFFSLYELGGCE